MNIIKLEEEKRVTAGPSCRQLVEAALDIGWGRGWGWQTPVAPCEELQVEALPGYYHVIY